MIGSLISQVGLLLGLIPNKFTQYTLSRLCQENKLLPCLSLKTLDEVELEYIGWDSFFNFNQALLTFLLRKSLHTDSIDWWNCFDLIENLIDLTLPHIFLY